MWVFFLFFLMLRRLSSHEIPGALTHIYLSWVSEAGEAERVMMFWMTSATWRKLGPLRRTMSACALGQDIATQTVIWGPNASASPGSLLEMQNLRCLPDLLNQTLSIFCQDSQVTHLHSNVWEAPLWWESLCHPWGLIVWIFVILGCSMILDSRTALNPRIATMELLRGPF